jgi:hypothetical protein
MSGATVQEKAAKRDACDRCHALKTRCVTLSNAQSCRRCSRLQLPCNYSPPMKIGRPARARARARTRDANSGTSLPSADRGTDGRESYSISHDTINVGAEVDNPSEPPLTIMSITQPEDAPFDWEFVWSPPLCSPHDLSATSWEPLNSDTLTDTSPLAQSTHSSSSTEVSDPSDEVTLAPQIPSAKPAPDGPTKRQTIVDGDDQTRRLLDLQERLLGLSKSLLAHSSQTDRVFSPSHPDPMAPCAGPDLPNIMEEIYQATEDLVNVAATLGQHPRQSEHTLHLDPALHSASPSPSAASTYSPHETSSRPYVVAGSFYRPHISTVLLLASCYIRLVDLYELLAAILQEQQRQQEQCQFQSRSPPVEIATTKPGCFRTQSTVPSFNMGKTRLDVPPSMGVKLHIHLIDMMLQRLRSAMHWCVSSLPEAANCGQSGYETSARSLLNKVVDEAAVTEDCPGIAL